MSFGNPTADELLMRDVVGEDERPQPTPMARYLRARTEFFDRVVVEAIERGVTQFVSVGAGFDGRAWRYGAPGTHWWEVDHPATQADKRSRLERLGIGTAHVSFVPFDLREPGLARALQGAGVEPGAPSLFTCEGVAVYLEPEVLTGTLGELREVAADATRLATSLGVRMDTPERVERRQRFEERVASLGEPARNRLGADEAAQLLGSTGWRPLDLSEPASLSGFVLAERVDRLTDSPTYT